MTFRLRLRRTLKGVQAVSDNNNNNTFLYFSLALAGILKYTSSLH